MLPTSMNFPVSPSQGNLVLVTLALNLLTGLWSAVATKKILSSSMNIKSLIPFDYPSMTYSNCNLGGLTIISEAFLSNCRNCLSSSELMRSFLMMILRRKS